MTRLCRYLTAVLLLGLLPGCGRSNQASPPRVMVRDLIADLDLAEVQREPGLVDLGTPGARALLRKGWWLDEGRAGQTFVWSDGPESELAFFLARSRDIPLTLRWVPYTEPRKPAQTVTLVLNGETVGQVTAAAGRNEARMVLPGNHLQAGENHLVLRYAWTRAAWSGSGEISGRHRPAVAWDFFRFETGVDEQSQLRAIGDRLALPFGWRMNFYLRLPARAVLTMDGLHLHGGQRGELRVTLRPAGGVEQELGRLHTGSGPSALKLPDEGDLPVQLSLIAVPERTAGPSGSFILRRPAIFASTGARPGLARALPAALRQAHPGARPRNVIIYLVDTLRAGHLGCYGYSRPVSPHIDAFAREAALFRHTVAQSSWTRPSTTTILTGLLPKTHDVFGHRDALPPQAVTLAERLQVRGYHTAAFVTNPNVAPDFGLDQGFEIYRLMGKKHRAATDVNRRAADWLDNEWKKDAPFFLYLHTMEPHAPYSAPLAFRQRFAPGVHESWMTMDILEQLEDGDLKATPGMRQSLTDLYDAEIAANDEAFGALIDLLVQRGLWDDTVVVFVSDHGEELADHGGWEHGKTLHNEMLDVPLIVRVPGAAGRVVERQAQQVDVVPTILEALGLQIPPGLEGRSLLASDDGTNPQDRPAYSWLEEISLRSAAVTTPEWRLIEKRFPIPGSFLYDRRADPGELRNLAGERPVRAGYLRAQLRAAERSRQGMLQARETTLDNDMQTQLKALGYLR